MSTTPPAPGRPADPGPLPSSHRIFVLLTFAMAAYFCGRGVDKALRPGGSDFTIYYRAGEAVLEGRSPQSVPGYIYLPVYAVAMVPISVLPYAPAAVLWQLLSFGALLLVARWTARFLTGDGARAPGWMTWAPTLCVLRLVDSNFANGQSNLLILSLVYAGMLAFRRGRQSAAGAWIAAGAALKILPAIFLGHFLARRSIRALAASGAVLVLILLLVPTLVLGWAPHADAIARWWQENPLPYLQGGDDLLEARAYLPGQSLTACAYRLLTETPATSAGSGSSAVNLVDLDPDTVASVVRLAGLALLLTTFVAIALRPARSSDRGFAREVALVLSTAVLVAPLVHKAHMLWVILAYACVLEALVAGRLRLLVRLPLALLLAVSILFVTGSAPGLIGRPLATGLLSHNVIFFGVLALHGALLAVHFGDPPAGRAGPGRDRAEPSPLPARHV